MEQRLIDAKVLIDTFEVKKAKAHDKSIKHLYGQNKNEKLYRKDCETESRCEYVLSVLRTTPTVDAVPVPDGGIGELSDGYHTFNGLYYQRMMLFAALVKTYKDRAWKSRRHSDGEPCFGGGWFIVGIDTPQGGFTYHYEDKYFELFDCVELPNGKEWDGHTEDDVTRLLTLDAVPVVRCKECRWACLAPQRQTATCMKKRLPFTHDYDWFCADGERRTDADRESTRD